MVIVDSAVNITQYVSGRGNFILLDIMFAYWYGYVAELSIFVFVIVESFYILLVPTRRSTDRKRKKKRNDREVHKKGTANYDCGRVVWL